MTSRSYSPSGDRFASVSRLPLPPQESTPRPDAWSPLRDPFVQGLAAVLCSGLFGMAGWAFRGSGFVLLGTIAVVLAITCAVAFVLLVGRAVSREKLIQYWSDRRALRLDLRKVHARNELLATTVRRIDMWQNGMLPDAQPALAQLVDEAHSVFAAYHDDTAVLLVIERGDRWQISHAAAPGGSRWSYLATGKHCPRRDRESIDARLRTLARHHRAFTVELPELSLVLAVLCQSPLDDESRSHALAELGLCFNLLAARWSRGAPRHIAELHPVGGRQT